MAKKLIESNKNIQEVSTIKWQFSVIDRNIVNVSAFPVSFSNLIWSFNLLMFYFVKTYELEWRSVHICWSLGFCAKRRRVGPDSRPWDVTCSPETFRNERLRNVDINLIDFYSSKLILWKRLINFWLKGRTYRTDQNDRHDISNRISHSERFDASYRGTKRDRSECKSTIFESHFWPTVQSRSRVGSSASWSTARKQRKPIYVLKKYNLLN